MTDTEEKIVAVENSDTVAEVNAVPVTTENATPAAQENAVPVTTENATPAVQENAAPAAEEPVKKKKGPEYNSNEYSFWRYLIFVVVGFGVGSMVIGSLFGALITEFVPVFLEGGYLYNVKASANVIIAFFFACIFVVLMLKPILHTSFKSQVTGNRKYKVSYGLGCLLIYAVVQIATLLIDSKYVSYQPADLGYRIVCILFCLILIPFQTTTEELVFRTSLGRLFMRNEVMKSVPKMLLVSAISGILFFAPHLANPEVAAYGMVAAVFSYFLTGFSLMLMSCITGSFEGALAVHALNNLWVSIVVTSEVSALNFAPLFLDTNDNVASTCVELVILYGLLIAWSIYYRKKHKLAEALVA